MLCMKWDDIKSLKLKVRRDSDRTMLDAKYQKQIRNWNRLDSALYDYFLAKLEKKIDLYGREEMAKHVQDLVGMLF